MDITEQVRRVSSSRNSNNEISKGFAVCECVVRIIYIGIILVLVHTGARTLHVHSYGGGGLFAELFAVTNFFIHVHVRSVCRSVEGGKDKWRVNKMQENST